MFIGGVSSILLSVNNYTVITYFNKKLYKYIIKKITLIYSLALTHKNTSLNYLSI